MLFVIMKNDNEDIMVSNIFAIYLLYLFLNFPNLGLICLEII